jgi:hypothetical protein
MAHPKTNHPHADHHVHLLAGVSAGGHRFPPATAHILAEVFPGSILHSSPPHRVKV